MSLSYKVGLLFSVVANAAVLHAAEPVQLTRDGRLKLATAVCSAGREVVYCELANPTLYRLMKLNLEDRTSQPLHPKADTSEFDPMFAADGKSSQRALALIFLIASVSAGSAVSHCSMSP